MSRWTHTLIFAASLLGAPLCWSQQPPAPAPSSARILLLPKRIVTGERATLAVLDVNGRLTPGVTVNFSNRDHLVTDATGRARFAAPLAAGVIYATIGERPERIYTTILRHSEAPADSVQISLAPRFSSLSDRFELSGSGFCGEADANSIRLGGKPALVLAASPASLIALPPADLPAGNTRVEVTCANRSAPPFSVTFLDLSLEADDSPLGPGERRALTVRVHGTDAKVSLQAHNLAPKVANLAGGNTVTVSSQGGAENVARFEVTGHERGSFNISIRLLSDLTPPTR